MIPPPTSPRLAGAALLEIGNELLSGKITDTNGPYLIGTLRECGYPLHELRIISDSIDEIAEHVRALSDRYEAVFTSGGVGPTHDDMTLPGIAKAFDESLTRNPTLERFIADFYGDRVNEHVLRMADVPESAVLLESERLTIPNLLVHNVHVMPGEPTIFKRKVDALKPRFQREPYFLKRAYLSLDEGEVAGILGALESAHAVAIGSYPRYDREADYAVLVTVESKNEPAVNEAFRELLERLPSAGVLRTG
ncbi:MAG: competence/damage-inducible protein A [Planctomycetota bacterium]